MNRRSFLRVVLLANIAIAVPWGKPAPAVEAAPVEVPPMFVGGDGDTAYRVVLTSEEAVLARYQDTLNTLNKGIISKETARKMFNIELPADMPVFVKDETGEIKRWSYGSEG